VNTPSRSFNPSRVDFVTLRLFCAVAKAGSMTKGAAHCHLALSAASRRLNEFEQTVGLPLLLRSAQGVALTAAGHVAMQHALRLFHGFEQFSSELQDYAKGVKGHVRLWANMSALTEFLPAALAEFLAHNPAIRVELEEQLSGKIVRALVDEVADIGVFAAGTPTHGLETRVFQTDQLFLVCPQTHPLARFRKLAFADCLTFDFVGLNAGSSLLELTSRAAADAGAPLRLRVQVRSFDAMCNMIGAGLGIGVMPLGVCKPQIKALKLKAIEIKDAWSHRELLIASRPSAKLPPAVTALLTHLECVKPR
jgi:DNA-binding transcriptional LysR family regulator